METPIAPLPDEPKKSNTGLIIAVVAAVVLCCCCLMIILGWQFGDQILSAFQ